MNQAEVLAGRVHLDNIRAWFASVQLCLKAGAVPVKSQRRAMNQLHPLLAAAPVSVCVQAEVLSARALLWIRDLDPLGAAEDQGRTDWGQSRLSQDPGKSQQTRFCKVTHSWDTELSAPLSVMLADWLCDSA